jgi:hypothetical protein
MKQKSEIYIYLAKRDKSSVKVIGSFPYETKVYPTRIEQEKIDMLNMNMHATSSIKRQAWDNRMDYEMFMETAGSFEELKSSLRDRGYSHLPNHQISTILNPGYINQNLLVTDKSTMMRRGSTIRR